MILLMIGNVVTTVVFDKMRGSAEKAQRVEVKVAYQEQTPVSGFFEIPVTQSQVFYVDSTNGSDGNDGLSPEEAFQTIDKLNTLTFIPGDEIRFKKGETFVGAFQPQGSGEDGNPIKIGSYGDGEAKPKLMPEKLDSSVFNERKCYGKKCESESCYSLL